MIQTELKDSEYSKLCNILSVEHKTLEEGIRDAIRQYIRTFDLIGS